MKGSPLPNVVLDPVRESLISSSGALLLREAIRVARRILRMPWHLHELRLPAGTDAATPCASPSATATRPLG